MCHSGEMSWAVTKTLFRSSGPPSTPAGELYGALPAVLLDEAHYAFGRLYGLLRVVRHPEPYEHVGNAHDAEPDLAVALGHGLYLLYRVAVHVYDVIEEVDRLPYGPPEPLPVYLVNPVAAGLLSKHAAQVYGAQVAGLVRQAGAPR